MASRIAVLGAAVGAVACCAGLPLIGAAVGGVGAGVVIVVTAGLLTAVALGVATALFVLNRRKRARTEARR